MRFTIPGHVRVRTTDPALNHVDPLLHKLTFELINEKSARIDQSGNTITFYRGGGDSGIGLRYLGEFSEGALTVEARDFSIDLSYLLVIGNHRLILFLAPAVVGFLQYVYHPDD